MLEQMPQGPNEAYIGALYTIHVERVSVYVFIHLVYIHYIYIEV